MARSDLAQQARRAARPAGTGAERWSGGAAEPVSSPPCAWRPLWPDVGALHGLCAQLAVLPAGLGWIRAAPPGAHVPPCWETFLH